MQENWIDSLPSFIKAQSITGLRLAMSKNNLRLKGFVPYFNIQFVKGGVDDPQNRGYWIAWYFESEIDRMKKGLE